MPKYQTIGEFMYSPFGESGSMDKNVKYAKLYEDFVQKHKIYIAGFTIIGESYYVHVRVPSESHSDGKYEYDVVIKFFTNKPELNKTISLRQYYMQFFSNSPGFMYRYAALYKKHGYLIKEIYDKLDPEYADVMPDKTNADMELSYDKSIFFACKFLSDGRFRYLNKIGLLVRKKKNPEKFFADISDFRSVKFDQDLMNTEKKLRKDIENQSKNKQKDIQKANKLKRKMASYSSSKGGNVSNHRVVKIKSGGHKPKIVAKKSTKR